MGLDLLRIAEQLILYINPHEQYFSQSNYCDFCDYLKNKWLLYIVV